MVPDRDCRINPRDYTSSYSLLRLSVICWPARVGVLIGSAIIFAIAITFIRWIGSRSFGEQFRVGLLWVVLMLIFEFSLGAALGYSWERMLSDYNMAEGGFMVTRPAIYAVLLQRWRRKCVASASIPPIQMSKGTCRDCRLIKRRKPSGSVSLSGAISADRFRLGLGNRCAVYFPSGSNDFAIWRTDRTTSTLLFSSVCTCNRCFHRCHLLRWRCRLSSLPGQVVSLALLSGLVCLFDYRHSAAFLRRVCVERETFSLNHSRSPRFRHFSLHCYLWPSKARSKSLAGVGWLCLYYNVSSLRFGPG